MSRKASERCTHGDELCYVVRHLDRRGARQQASKAVTDQAYLLPCFTMSLADRFAQAFQE